MCVAANSFELFSMTHLANIERFYTILIFYFKYQILYASKFTILGKRKSTEEREGAFYSSLRENAPSRT